MDLHPIMGQPVHMEEGLMSSNGTVDPRMLIHTPDVDVDMGNIPTNEAVSEENPTYPQEMDYQERGDTSSLSSPDSGAFVEVSPELFRKGFLPTGVCYDERMKYHANADFSANPAHPEDPRRIELIFNEFKKAGLVYSGNDTDLSKILKDSPEKFMWRIATREATKAEVCLAHDPDHWDWVESLNEKSAAELRQLTSTMDEGRKSLYVGTLTHYSALLSAGGAIETCRHVVAGNIKNGIAVIRPPGHHAERDESMGFCIFNNVPIAARVCQTEYRETCRKILILDWDVHHGNGIQNIFYDDPNVLYISIHVYQNGNFYPGQPVDPSLVDGGPENVGSGYAAGMNVNIGWNDQGMGDGEYMAAFQKVVMPIAQEFDPDLVIISAGFDAAEGDELGGCHVTPACYAHMTHMLMSLANGKVAVCLEGGYNLRAISKSALAVAKTLMGEPPERMVIPSISRAGFNVIEKIKQYHSPYWNCMRTSQITNALLSELPSTGFETVVGDYRQTQLAREHNMYPLYIHRTKVNESFSGRVLTTPNSKMAKSVLIIIHDPPELLAMPDPYDNRVIPANSYVIDGVKNYIDWGIKEGYAILDISSPMKLVKPEPKPEESPWQASPTEPELQEQLRELVCYVYDNFIEGWIADNMVLMGVGESYVGVKMLLTHRGKFPVLLPRPLANIIQIVRPASKGL